MPSILTHLPTEHLQPTIQLSSHELEQIVASRRIVLRFIQTPKKQSSMKKQCLKIMLVVYHLQ